MKPSYYKSINFGLRIINYTICFMGRAYSIR
nr:MAG TPA: hypothetical protein [Bacteriophage sp.]